jgi:hypothetical protein
MNYFFAFLVFIIPAFLFAQQPDDEVNTFAYHKNHSVLVALTTNGYSLTYRNALHKTAEKKFFWNIELANLKHSKEIKQSYAVGYRSYVYGKTHSVFPLRIGFGTQKLFGQKSNFNGVELNFLYQTGLSLAILKPIYYRIIYVNDRFPQEEKFNPEIHTPNNIISRAGFMNGFNEMGINPGVYTKFALNFEYASENASIKAIETGVVIDAYFKPIEMLAFENKDNFFVGFYVALQYGYKKYR